VPHSLFHRAQGLIEHLAQDPLRAHVLTYLSRELAPSGEPCAVAFAQLSRDGKLHVVAHEGFAQFDPKTVTELHINSERAASVALRNGRLMLFSRSEITELVSDLPQDLRNYWRSSAAIPIGLQSIYFINFREDVTGISDYEEFLNVIGSLLTSFEWNLAEKCGTKKNLWFDEKAMVLTEREERILTLIREGRTNLEIAEEMAYSESLIRQLTVVIYRKLGVSGRKELISDDIKPKRAIRNAIAGD
jgi:DNA-binding CsgD family transcriptional regulator